MDFKRINTDGTTDALPLPNDPDARYEALRSALGDWITLYHEAYHGLTTHEIWHLDDWYGQPTNTLAQQLAGIEHDLRGPVLLVPLPEGENLHAEQAHQVAFFDRMFAAMAGAEVDDAVLIVLDGPG